MAGRSVLDVLEAVAPLLMQEPTYLSEMPSRPGWNQEWCQHCDGEADPRRDRTRRVGPFPHEDDCPWVEAVAATGIFLTDDGECGAPDDVHSG